MMKMNKDYQELPCRRCGRIWKWSLDKTSTPYCPKGHGCAGEPTIEEKIDKLQRDVDWITQYLLKKDQPPPHAPTATCSRCGMNWSGSMGYVCYNSECPIYMSTSKTQEKHAGERFRIKSTCTSCGYQSMDIYPDQNCMCPLINCEGSME